MLNRIVFAAALTASALAMSANAYAADVIGEEPPVPEAAPVEMAPVARWSGIYVGVNAGYGWGSFDTSAGNLDADGFSGGAYAGINFQADRFVYGAEADAGYSWLEGVAPGAVAQQGFNGALRARLGYDFDPFLLYGAGGVAVTQAEAFDGAVSDSNTHFGWTVGAGAEAFITQNTIGRFEYRYTNFNDKTYALTAPVSAGLDTHEIRFGVGVKF